MKISPNKIIAVAFSGILFATNLYAATSISLAPTSVTLQQGQSLKQTITINPQGVKNYTLKLELRYPADLLEIKSFTFGSAWTALNQPGYDLIDNTTGILIKTAGYPGGLSSSATFGTVNFIAKKSGSGTVSLNSNSLGLDANNQNTLDGLLAKTAVSVLAVTTPVPAPILKVESKIIKHSSTTAPTALAKLPITKPKDELNFPQTLDATTTTNKEPIILRKTQSADLLALVDNNAGDETSNLVIKIISIQAIIVALGYLIYILIRGMTKKK